MKLAVIGAATGALAYRLLDNKLNELIESSQYYLFYMLCGQVQGAERKEKSLGELWANNNGIPIIYITEKTVEKLFARIVLEADYVIFILNGNSLINNFFMRYKMSGKHGSVIKINE